MGIRTCGLKACLIRRATIFQLDKSWSLFEISQCTQGKRLYPLFWYLYLAFRLHGSHPKGGGHETRNHGHRHLLRVVVIFCSFSLQETSHLASAAYRPGMTVEARMPSMVAESGRCSANPEDVWNPKGPRTQIIGF